MSKVVVDVRGNNSEWGIPSNLSARAIADIREDGLNIIVPENKIPFLIVDAGLLRPWCFFQDILNLKNPFRK